MARIDHQVRPAGPPDDEDPPATWRRRFARFWVDLLDWLWNPDERFAEKRGWTATRGAWGGSVTLRDPRFDRSHTCDGCAGSGRHPITGAECPDCSGVGVVTDPERGEQS
jgi:hypothetical protein